MKDKSLEELRDSAAEEIADKYIKQEGKKNLYDSGFVYDTTFFCAQDGWDACSKLFLEKHPVVLGLAEAYKELLDNLAHYASPRRDEYHPVKHEWKEVSE